MCSSDVLCVHICSGSPDFPPSIPGQKGARVHSGGGQSSSKRSPSARVSHSKGYKARHRAAFSCRQDCRHLLPSVRSQLSGKPPPKLRGGRTGSLPLPTPRSLARGHSHFGAERWRWESGLVPSSSGLRLLPLRKAPTRALRRKKRGSGRSTRRPPGLFRAAGAEAAAARLPPVCLFLGLFRLSFARPGPLLPGLARSGDSGFCFYKVSSGRRQRPAPRVPPAPPPSGLGRGRGL